MIIHSFLLVGQSNMAGRGFFDEAVSVDISKIVVLRNGRWQPMYRPINCDRGFSGVNLAESFAEQYSKKYNVKVGLIPCADGGTSLEQWRQGGLLYDNAVMQVKLAERTSTLAGILWHQGEADCGSDYYPTYGQRLISMLSALKKDLNAYDIPVLLGGLGEFLSECELAEHLKNYRYVNEALSEVAEKIEMTGYVSAEGLESNPDNLHFNSKSLYEFGIRYFNVFEKLRKVDKVFCDKVNEDDAIRTDMESL